MPRDRSTKKGAISTDAIGKRHEPKKQDGAKRGCPSKQLPGADFHRSAPKGRTCDVSGLRRMTCITRLETVSYFRFLRAA
jgi:hypothetical protein